MDGVAKSWCEVAYSDSAVLMKYVIFEQSQATSGVKITASGVTVTQASRWQTTEYHIKVK